MTEQELCYQQASTLAGELKEIGLGEWVPEVWENLDWHWVLIFGGVVRLSPPYAAGSGVWDCYDYGGTGLPQMWCKGNTAAEAIGSYRAMLQQVNKASADWLEKFPR